MCSVTSAAILTTSVPDKLCIWIENQQNSVSNPKLFGVCEVILISTKVYSLPLFIQHQNGHFPRYLALYVCLPQTNSTLSSTASAATFVMSTCLPS